MGNDEFLELGKNLVIEYCENNHINDGIAEENVYCVWIAKALQNNKGLFATNYLDDLYFEVTYNGDKKEVYFDAYTKILNRAKKV